MTWCWTKDARWGAGRTFLPSHQDAAGDDEQAAFCARVRAADPGLFRQTRHLVVDVTDASSNEAGTQWWLELTGAGGEGIVVKPLANLSRIPNGALMQPGQKVCEREYLRIMYGPDYTEPELMPRLKQRSLGTKRALAQREYALGLESLRR